MTRFARKILVLSFVFFPILVAAGPALGQLTSTNWSGYVVVANGVTAVSASWVIPAISSCATTVGGTMATVSQGISVWIGFDGYANNQIPEQIGTNSFCYNGSPWYYAWEEDPTTGAGNQNAAIPAFKTQEIYPGDHITASITYLGNNQFQMKIADTSVSASRTYTVLIPNAGRKSAEWIVEAFTNSETQSEVSLPTFRPITISDCTASVNNVAGSITQNGGQPLDMVSNNGNVLVAPQNLNQAGTSFQIALAG